MSIISFISINSTEITEHNRQISTDMAQQVSDVQTASGKTKRFYKKNKKSIKITYSYLPSLAAKTVDGRASRDFISNLALTNPSVLVSYIDNPSNTVSTFYGFIDSYSETLVRRDLQTQCSYYDISFNIEEK